MQLDNAPLNDMYSLLSKERKTMDELNFFWIEKPCSENKRLKRLGFEMGIEIMAFSIFWFKKGTMLLPF